MGLLFIPSSLMPCAVHRGDMPSTFAEGERKEGREGSKWKVGLGSETGRAGGINCSRRQFDLCGELGWEGPPGWGFVLLASRVGRPRRMSASQRCLVSVKW